MIDNQKNPKMFESRCLIHNAHLETILIFFYIN
jgi:hypothetical protein